MTGRPRHALDIAVVESPGRVAVLDLTRLDRPPVVLSGSAVDIWLAIDGARDEAAICEQVAAAYAMAPEQIRGEVLACLAQLNDLGLVQHGDNGG